MLLAFLAFSTSLMAQETTFVPSEHGFIKSDREDGRFISSRRIVLLCLKIRILNIHSIRI